MAAWFKFTKDYDYRWPSGSVTAFKKDMVVNVKDDVFDAAKAAKVGTVTQRPKNGDKDHVATPSNTESKPSNSVSKKAPKKAVEVVAAPVVTDVVIIPDTDEDTPAAAPVAGTDAD